VCLFFCAKSWHDNSISSLSEYIGCFDKSDYIYLGERYGYDLFSDDHGYNYITGGGAIVFNVKTVEKFIDSCSCPSTSSPDDMIIASCLKQFNIEPIHSSLFHQARTKDYPHEILEKNSISFHKFWDIEPIVVYEKWFRKKDEEYFKINQYFKHECLPSLTSSTRDANFFKMNKGRDVKLDL
jgi:UDP-glucose:O-linked fucose beta-1,3-glucosyltransferase